jgi:hypothetical protein
VPIDAVAAVVVAILIASVAAAVLVSAHTGTNALCYGDDAMTMMMMMLVAAMATLIDCWRRQLARVMHDSMLRQNRVLSGAPSQLYELLALKFVQVFAMPDEIVYR